MNRIVFWTLYLIFSNNIFAQYVINGKVTDANTGEALPFVIVQVKGKTVGTQTDFDGNYTLKLTYLPDSLKATYVGYFTKVRGVKPGLKEQTLNFQLEEQVNTLEEVVVKPGENPAWAILRKAARLKDKYNLSNLTSYEYENYVRLNVDINNVSKKWRKNLIMRPVLEKLDSMKRILDDEGKMVIPVFMTENISDIYYQKEPYYFKEVVRARQRIGVFDETNANFLENISGSSFLDFNLNKNWIRHLTKDFISPIADGWKDYYEVDLEDSLMLDTHFCYKINVKPKRRGDLAFRGTIWITKNESALKRADLQVGKEANINFVERFKIQQELLPTGMGPWYVSKFRMVIDMAEVSDSSAGILATYYISNKNIQIGKVRPPNFYTGAYEVNDDANQFKQEDWEHLRHEQLSAEDKAIRSMIDTIRHIPIVHSYIDIIDLVVNGYKRFNKIEFGPYLDTYSWNNVEGHRPRVGFRTNLAFSRKWQFAGYLGYGTQDQLPKYNLMANYWISKKHWAYVGLEHSYDLELAGFYSSYFYTRESLLYTFSRFGDMSGRSPFYYRTSFVHTGADLKQGVSLKVKCIHQLIEGVDNSNPDLQFAYLELPGDSTSGQLRRINNAELIFELRLSRKENFIYRNHSRIPIGTTPLPKLTLRYHTGIKGFFGSQFLYQKFTLNVQQNITVGKFGQTNYNLSAYYIPNVLPFPLLHIHVGNPSPFFIATGFNMMNFFEFVSNRTAILHAEHHFNGFFFNRVPLFNRLKWREVISSSFAVGSNTRANQLLIPNRINPETGISYQVYNILDPMQPYAEIGFGIENIFKFLRIESYHRLTYLNQPYPVSKWGIKVAFQFVL